MSNHDPHTHPERVLISYSHDSAEHVSQVADLAGRLRGEGVLVALDQYNPHPPEGWPQWMRRELEGATHVLIVCTETYLRRVNLREEPSRGLGATWEGSLVIHAAYASQGRNEKFIPIVFSSSDQQFVPDFLQGVTRYDLSTESGYQQLYARLTGQPLVEVPPIGPRRTVGPGSKPAATPARAVSAQPAVPAQSAVASSGLEPARTDLVLIEAKGTKLFIAAQHIHELRSYVEFTLIPDDRAEAFLSELRGGWKPTRVWVAYGATASEGTVVAADPSRDAGVERWTLVVMCGEQPRGCRSEMGMSGESANYDAELRARCLLLNEKPPAEVPRWEQIDTMPETLVQAWGSRPLTESPLPALYYQFRADVPFFLAAAQLVGVLELRREQIVVEHVLELTLLQDVNQLYVRFCGRRRKEYTTQPAHEIAFEGVCALE
jgi:hypothetical protein